ncbi:3-hydroxyacyl-ACP dehydratase FabZ [Aquimarina spinulae]|uniref:3-hydroxyacyl-ACP dehydratase FabZ n=1 Tax=Aquimarina spinulae TaxID=1192023 RepID=UPI000D560A4B|nr:3-hydroxyacyl-ACP dehydratase FabZ [Aquimarina spinulae]
MKKAVLQNYQIQKLLPHRYPFQLVDQVIEYEKGKSIIAIKAVGIGEPAFQGHFPELPIFPGVLLTEAMGQTCGLLVQLSNQDWEEQQPINYKINSAKIGVFGEYKVKFFTPVVPGTLVYLHGELDWTMGSASCLKIKAYNGDILFAKGTVTVAMIDKKKLIPQTETLTT